MSYPIPYVVETLVPLPTLPTTNLPQLPQVTVPLPTGPVSNPSSNRNVLAPVTWSPAMIARCTGAAPRHAGSSEKCRFTQPCRGRSSAARGTRAP